MEIKNIANGALIQKLIKENTERTFAQIMMQLKSGKEEYINLETTAKLKIDFIVEELNKRLK